MKFTADTNIKLKVGMLFCCIILLTIGGCESPSTERHEEEHKHEKNKGSKDDVHLLQRQIDVMGIELGKFQYLNLSTTVKSNGQLNLPPQNKASQSAIIGGRVKSINVLEGDYVVKGQTLATLEDIDFVEMQEQYMNAASRLRLLENDYNRKKTLFEDSICSEKVFQEAEAKYLSSLAILNSLEIKLQMLGVNLDSVERGDFLPVFPVYSPIDGFVRYVKINMGKYVQPQQEMFEIVDNKHIHIDLIVYEQDMRRVKNGQKVIFSLSNYPDSVFQGSIFAVGKSFEQEPKAVVVHAEMDNKKGDLLAGMYVDARIVTSEANVRAVPNEAIVSDGGLDYIFVLKPSPGQGHSHKDEENHEHAEGGDFGTEYVFRKIEVNTGATDIGFTEVVPAYNLPDHIQIVTKGAFYLLAEMKKGEGGHGHHH